MRILMVGFVALTVGVGGGAFLGGVQLKNEILAEQEEAKADSLAALDEVEGARDPVVEAEGRDESSVTVELGEDSATVDLGEGEQGDSAASPREDTTEGTDDPMNGITEPRVETDAATTQEAPAATQGTPASTQGTPASTQPAHEPESSDLEEGAEKLSKIFGAMKAKDAAAVLQEMEDGEVKAILERMSDRRAAQILGEFEPERAATLSRAVLTGTIGS